MTIIELGEDAFMSICTENVMTIFTRVLFTVKHSTVSKNWVNLNDVQSLAILRTFLLHIVGYDQ